MSRPRFLCLHGWRTSADIMMIQMMSFQNEVDIECIYIDAPFSASGEPYPAVKFYFPNMSYYEW